MITSAWNKGQIADLERRPPTWVWGDTVRAKAEVARKKGAFIRAAILHGGIDPACEAVGWRPSTAMRHMHLDFDFLEAFNRACAGQADHPRIAEYLADLEETASEIERMIGEAPGRLAEHEAACARQRAARAAARALAADADPEAFSPALRRFLAEVRSGRHDSIKAVCRAAEVYAHSVARWRHRYPDVVDHALQSAGLETRRLGRTRTDAVGDRIEHLLGHLRDGKSVKHAAELAGLDNSGVYRWRHTQPDLWARIEEALDAGGGPQRAAAAVHRQAQREAALARAREVAARNRAERQAFQEAAAQQPRPQAPAQAPEAPRPAPHTGATSGEDAPQRPTAPHVAPDPELILACGCSADHHCEIGAKLEARARRLTAQEIANGRYIRGFDPELHDAGRAVRIAYLWHRRELEHPAILAAAMTGDWCTAPATDGSTGRDQAVRTSVDRSEILEAA